MRLERRHKSSKLGGALSSSKASICVGFRALAAALRCRVSG